MKSSTKARLQKFADWIYRWWPRAEPPIERFRQAQVVAHRGVHDNVVIPENTMEAFQLAQNLGAWAIEMDIRWTHDLVPVVFHDADAQRVFGQPLIIANMTLLELRQKLPLIPTLEEVVTTFGGKIHLMIELKDGHFPNLEEQRKSLRHELQSLQAKKDYHILSLYPHLLEETFPLFPPSACLLVAETNVSTLAQKVKEKGYAGLAGHFLLMSKAHVRDLLDRGFQVGCGFIASDNSLKRELARGVPWIFTNDTNLVLRLIKKRLKDTPQ